MKIINRSVIVNGKSRNENRSDIYDLNHTPRNMWSRSKTKEGLTLGDKCVDVELGTINKVMY